MNFSGANQYIISKKDLVSPFCHDIVLQFCTRGSVMVGVVFEILLLLLIFSIQEFSRSGLRVMSLGEIWYLPSTYGTSMLIILTPSTFLLCISALICLDIYLIFVLIGGHVTLHIPSYLLFQTCLWLFPLDGWTLG